MKDKLIGLVGQGWIGKNYADDFERRGYRVVRYSKEEQYIMNKDRIRDCDIVFIAVPTPTTPQGFDDRILREVIRLVGSGKTAVIKSTILPGTTESIQKENPDIFVMHSPEFLSRNTAAYDAAHPDRNIVGVPVKSELYYQKAREVISVLPNAPYNMICAAKNAEIVKYGSNCYFYFKNIFFNIFYDLAGETGCDWDIVHQSIIADPRIGEVHTNPIDRGGRGAGGCLIKDFQAFIDLYGRLVDDQTGKIILESIKDKNLQLLVDSKKELDSLNGIYGSFIFEEKMAVTPKRYKIVVTGGAGFIGSNLVDQLVRIGHDVVIIDDLSSGKKININPGAIFYQADVRDREKLDEIFLKEGRIDYVFHLAAQIDVRKSVADPIADNSINVGGSLNVFFTSAKYNIGKVIYFSTAGVYGDVESPVNEDAPNFFDSPYGLNKYSSEKNLEMISRIHGLKYVIFRPSNAYGPRQYSKGEGAVISVFSHNLASGQESTIYGDGLQTRDLIYVEDIASACIAALDEKVEGIFNISTNVETSILDLIKLLENAGGQKFLYRFEQSRPGEIRKSVLDNSKAKNTLGWMPRTNLEEGLKKTIEWSKKQLGL